MITHVINTRYGLGVYDEEWFDLRFPIFEKITFNSIVNQTSKDFYWCIHIDNAMPEKAKQRLIKLTETHKNILIIQQDYWTSWDGIESVLSKVGSTKVLITTKIDDDDALREDYVSEVNNFVKENAIEKTTYIGFPRGYRLDLVTGLAVEELHPTFLFVTCATPIKSENIKPPIVTAYSTAHTKVKEFAQKNNFDTKLIKDDVPMWIYVRHQYADSINPRAFNSNPEDTNQSSFIETLNRKFGISLENYQECVDFYSSQFGQRNLKTSLLETTHSSILKQIKDLDIKITKCKDLDEKRKLQLQRNEFLNEYRSIGKNVITNSSEDLLEVKSGRVGSQQIINYLEHHFAGIETSVVESGIKLLTSILGKLESPKFNYKGLIVLENQVFKEASRELGQVERYLQYVFSKHQSGGILEVHNGFSLRSKINSHLNKNHTFYEINKSKEDLFTSLNDYSNIKLIYTRMFSELGFESPKLMELISNSLSEDGYLVGSINHVVSDVGFKLTPVGINSLANQYGLEIIKIHSGVDIFTLFARELAKTVGSTEVVKSFAALLNDKSLFNEIIEMSSYQGKIDKKHLNLLKLHFTGEYHFLAKKIQTEKSVF